MAHQTGSTESSLLGTSSVLSNDSLWILDSGAIDHMVSSTTVLTQSYPVHDRTVQLHVNASHGICAHGQA